MVNRLVEAGANLEAQDHTGRVPIQHLHGPDEDRGRGEQEQEARANDRSQSFRTGRAGLSANSERWSIRPIPEGRTPLHRAAGEGACLGVHRLLQEGADPNTADRDRVTPLHLGAGRTDGAEVVETLACGWRHAPRPGQRKVADTVAPGRSIRFTRGREPSAEGKRQSECARHGRCDTPALRRLQSLAGRGPGIGRSRGRSECARQRGADSSRRGDRAGIPPRSWTCCWKPAHNGSSRTIRSAGAAAGKTTDAYHKEFADDIIAQIERGTAPWQKHWQPGENRMPANFSTGARYQGGNALQLMVKRTQRAWNDNRWGTYKQIKEAGGQVRKGERGTTVLVYKPPKRADGTEATPGEVAEDKPKNPDAEKTTRPMWAALHRVQRRAGRRPQTL